MIKRLFCLIQELLCVFSSSQGTGANNTNTAWRKISDSLAKSFETGQGSVLSRHIKNILLVQSGCEPYHFFKTVDYLQFSVIQAAHNHVKTVGAQINSSNDFRWFF